MCAALMASHLLGIEARRARVDPSDVEGIDHLGDGEHIAVLQRSPSREVPDSSATLPASSPSADIRRTGSFVPLG